MLLNFLGTGEACDERRGNTSVLIEDPAASVLLDCGFTVPHRYFARVSDADALDLLWISHFHADHYFGLPLMLLRFWEMGRRKKLTVAGPKGIAEISGRLLEMAYPGFRGKLGYPLSWKEFAPGERAWEEKIFLHGASTIHCPSNLALRVELGNKKIFYSGDGRPSEESITLMAGCDIIIHEAFGLQTGMEHHGSVEEVVAFGKRLKPPLLALVHVGRKGRSILSARLQSLAEELKPTMLLLPEDGESLQL